MAYLHRWIHGDPMGCQRLRESVTGKPRRVLHGDGEVRGLAASGDGSKGAQKRLVDLTIKPDMRLGASGRGDDLILQLNCIVWQRWVPACDGWRASGCSGRKREVVNIVIDGERGNRRAIVPLQIVLRPT